MILLVKKRKVLVVILFAVVVAVAAFAAAVKNAAPAADAGSVFRVYVAGTGTVEGRWSGNTGAAVVRVETRPGPRQGKELKVVDLLVANRGSGRLKFNPDVALVNRYGGRYGLKGAGQSEVMIGPGALSRGTVMIDVPRGIPDSGWELEIKGGNLKGKIVLPLRVQKVTSGQ